MDTSLFLNFYLVLFQPGRQCLLTIPDSPGEKENRQSPLSVLFRLQQSGDDLLFRLAVIRLIGAAQNRAGFLFGDLLKHAFTVRVCRIGKDGIGVVLQARAMIAHDVAHQTDEYEIRRVSERIPQFKDAFIFLWFKVFEMMNAAPGKESFPGAR